MPVVHCSSNAWRWRHRLDRDSPGGQGGGLPGTPHRRDVPAALSPECGLLACARGTSKFQMRHPIWCACRMYSHSVDFRLSCLKTCRMGRQVHQTFCACEVLLGACSPWLSASRRRRLLWVCASRALPGHSPPHGMAWTGPRQFKRHSGVIVPLACSSAPFSRVQTGEPGCRAIPEGKARVHSARTKKDRCQSKRWKVTEALQNFSLPSFFIYEGPVLLHTLRLLSSLHSSSLNLIHSVCLVLTIVFCHIVFFPLDSLPRLFSCLASLNR